MDILEENLPQLLPKEQSSHAAPASFSITSSELYGRGVAANETFFPELAQTCDDGYLRLVWEKLQRIEFDIIVGISFCLLFRRETIGRGGTELANLLSHAQNMQSQALSDLTELQHELLRLRAQRELFENAQKAAYFWKKTAKKLKRVKKFVHMFEQVEEFLDDCQRHVLDLLRVKPTRPLNNALAAKPVGETPPWQTWCRQLPLHDNSAVVKELRAKHRDMELATTQLLPVQGVLIAEHWRRKVETVVQDIIQRSASPALAQTQLPNRFALTMDNRNVPGIYAVVREPSRNPPQNPQTKKQFAFGPRSWEASMARLMAYMEEDITSRGDKRAMFLGTFQTPQGKEMRLDPDQWEAEDQKLYQSRRR